MFFWKDSQLSGDTPGDGDDAVPEEAQSWALADNVVSAEAVQKPDAAGQHIPAVEAVAEQHIPAVEAVAEQHIPAVEAG